MSEFLSSTTLLLETYLGDTWWYAVSGVVAGLMGLSWLFLGSGPKPFKPPVDVNRQSVDIGDGVHVSPLVLDKLDGKPLEYLYEDAKTLHEVFMRGLRIARNGKCLGKKTSKGYEWLTYQEVYDRFHAFGSGLLNLGLKPCPETFIGVYSVNRIEWALTEQACNMFSMVLVALYDTLGKKACQYIVNLTEMSTVVCDKEEKVQSLLDYAEQMPTLRTIIAMDTISESNTERAKKHNIKIMSFDEVEDMGRKNLHPPVPPKPSDLSTISFTSGTTGDPKGVMLTHGNIVSNVSGFLYISQMVHVMSPDDAFLSYLPMAHMYERTCQTALFMKGSHIGFYSGDVKLILEDLKALRPSVFATVPRLLNRIRDKVYAGASSSRIKKFLLDLAVSRKTKLVKRGVITKATIWDKLVFRKIQNLLGGRIDVVFTASAPVSEDTLDFIKCGFGCMVMEAYGQTETNAAITVNFPGDTSGGHVGGPLVCNYVKLADVPEMDYYAKDQTGEVCVKGPNRFQGYYKNPKCTKETIDEDGWCHTGDIGMWLSNGALKIIDRRKHIFKLAQGEYVAPEKIESVYAQSKYVAQIFVDGNSFKTCCMGIVIPDEEFMKVWAANNGFPTDMKELCKLKKVKDIILKDLVELGRKAGLKGFEQVMDIAIHPELFSVENNLLTPTFKSKRPDLRQTFKKTLEELYAQHSL